MKRIFYAVIFVGLMFLGGCGHSITSGEVCNLYFEPAHDVTTLVLAPDGESLTSDTYPVPNRWWLTFRRIDEKTGKWVKRTIQVNSTEYDKAKIGDFYDTGE